MFSPIPIAFSNIIGNLFQYQGSYGWVIVVCSIVEIVLILWAKTPKWIKFSSNKYLNALFFYMILNMVTNIAYFIYLLSDFKM